jgi:hypothetical protein
MRQPGRSRALNHWLENEDCAKQQCGNQGEGGPNHPPKQAWPLGRKCAPRVDAVSKRLTKVEWQVAANAGTTTPATASETSLQPLASAGGFSLPGQLGRCHIITQMVARLAAMTTCWPMVMVERNTAMCCIVPAPSGPEPVR